MQPSSGSSGSGYAHETLQQKCIFSMLTDNWARSRHYRHSSSSGRWDFLVGESIAIAFRHLWTPHVACKTCWHNLQSKTWTRVDTIIGIPTGFPVDMSELSRVSCLSRLKTLCQVNAHIAQRVKHFVHGANEVFQLGTG